MNDWRKDNFPRPQARLPLDAEDWSWREDRGSNGPGPDRDPQPVRPRQGTKTGSRARSNSKGAEYGTGNARPVPRMPKSRPETQVRSKGITLAGTLLILGLTVLAFAGGRLFGRVEEPATGAQPETPAQTVPVPALELAPAAPALEPVVETPMTLPAAFARAPVVCLDPGHGGEDRGFSRFFENDIPAMEESMLTLEQAWDLEARLQQRGYKVVMTREADTAVNVDGRDVNGDGRTAAHDAPRSNRNKNLDELQARINICNGANADLLVSMHVNGYSTGGPHGFETWFTRERQFGDRNAVFATLAYAHLKEQLAKIGYVLPAEDERGVLPDTTADVQMEHSLFRHFIMTGPEVPGVVKASKMPGAIVEALFVSNDGDAAVLSAPEGRNAIVTAYENAIVEYFERYPPEAS
jgi:N-acetylmuramoyl-L-alanine amidase